MKINEKTEQIAVTKPALDFCGSSCVEGDAFLDAFSFVGTSLEGLTVVMTGSTAGHFATSSEICDLSQPKKQVDSNETNFESISLT